MEPLPAPTISLSENVATLFLRDIANQLRARLKFKPRDGNVQKMLRNFYWEEVLGNEYLQCDSHNCILPKRLAKNRGRKLSPINATPNMGV